MAGYTKVENSILDSKDLSFEAKGIYSILARHITIPNFTINKTHIKSVTGLGEIRFSRAWKELKEKGLLIQKKKSIKGRFQYEYTLRQEAKAAAPVKQNKPKQHIDSDGNVPIEGQVNIDDVAVTEETASDENIETIVKTTGLNKEYSKKLLEVAKNDISKVIEGHKYVMQQTNVKNIYGYIKWAIKNNIFNIISAPRTSKGNFNNFTQRNYDFNKLEKALLYGEPYELPI